MRIEFSEIAKRRRCVYVWISDGNANLNIDLIRRGSCPAGVMLMRVDGPLFLEEGDGYTIFVSDDEVAAFTGKALAAEAAAQKEGLGIWSGVDE